MMLKPSFLSDEYLVSDEGYVLNKKGTHKLYGSVNHAGYMILNLLVAGKRIGIAEHTLVARAFCEGYKEGLQVNHKDGNTLNNRAENLEWVTPLENIHHSMEVLGHDKIGIKNVNAKTVYGYDKKTKELVYEFPCVMDACKFLKPDGTKAELRHIQCLISQVALRYKGRKSYKGVIWTYNKM